MRRRVSLLLAGCMAGCMLTAAAGAQTNQSHVVGTVLSTDATATGVLEVSSGRSVLGSSSSLTAGMTHSARVNLVRGGELVVCQGSTTHLSGSLPLGRDRQDPLVVGLDRGAMEVKMNISSSDAIITPDLRLVVADGNTHGLDLAVRVTVNGDTCIDNRGRKAPVLNISDAFDTGTYQLKPGQRALFEHGSLHEVVDRELGPCGCPAANPGMSLADAALSKGRSGSQPGGTKTYPFPEAVSEGLVPPTPPPAEAAGVTHTQVTTTLTANPGSNPENNPGMDSGAASAPVTTPDEKTGVFRSIGHFFKHIFVR